MIGVLCLVWVFYYRNYVLVKSRAKLNILNAKEIIQDHEESSVIPSANASNNVPWMEILNKPSFWLVFFRGN